MRGFTFFACLMALHAEAQTMPCAGSCTSFSGSTNTMSAAFSVTNTNSTGMAIQGSATGSGSGVWGSGATGYGVYGISTSNVGVGGYGDTMGGYFQAVGTGMSSTGVHGTGRKYGGWFESTATNDGVGLLAKGKGNGLYAQCTAATGSGHYGVFGTVASDQTSYGVYGHNTSAGHGVLGVATGYNGSGVQGQHSATQGYGVSGINDAVDGYGVVGRARATSGSGAAIYGDGTTSGSYAGYFYGRTHVAGTLSKSAGSFLIDHPLDPANKFLAHSFVESPDMKNMYDGVAVLDKTGRAVVTLPDWFQALNRDFRYQLTCIGGFAPVFIEREIEKNQFTIAGGVPDLKVSWQVTGTRQDAYAEANRIPNEYEKPAEQKGRYLHPEVFGKPASLGMPKPLTAPVKISPMPTQSSGR